MTGMIRKATLLVALGLVVASAAMAGIPVPGLCAWPSYIDLVGCDGTVVDPYGAFTVTVNDVAGPIEGSVVIVTFNTDVMIADGFPEFFSCQSARAVTDVNGVASFGGVIGGSRGTPTGNTGENAATVRADGYLLGTAHVCSFDANGGGGGTPGVEIGDLGSWVDDYAVAELGPPLMLRSDFNHFGDVEIGDLGTWVDVWSSLLSEQSCGALCP